MYGKGNGLRVCIVFSVGWVSGECEMVSLGEGKFSVCISGNYVNWVRGGSGDCVEGRNSGLGSGGGLREESERCRCQSSPAKNVTANRSPASSSCRCGSRSANCSTRVIGVCSSSKT